MGRVSQVLGYFFGFIILIIGIGLIVVALVQPFLFLGSIPIIGLLLIIFGFIIMYLGHRSRPTREKKMLKMQAEEFFREQALMKKMEKREKKEMKKAEKEREKAMKRAEMEMEKE